MVLQAENPTLFGFAEPGEVVQVSVPSILATMEAKNATTDPTGKWLVQLGSRPASFIPVTILISDSKNSTSLDDVLFGDVWWCGGQSE